MARAEGSSVLLLKHKLRFCRELDVTQVLPQLVQKRVFTFLEERDILNRPDAKLRAEALVDLLLRKTPEALTEFAQCLGHTSTPYLRLLILQNNDSSSPAHLPGGASAYTSPISAPSSGPPSHTSLMPGSTSRPATYSSSLTTGSASGPITYSSPQSLGSGTGPGLYTSPQTLGSGTGPGLYTSPQTLGSGTGSGLYTSPQTLGSGTGPGLYTSPQTLGSVSRGQSPKLDNRWRDVRHGADPGFSPLEVASRSPKINNREVERNQMSVYSQSMPEYKQPPQSPGYIKPWDKPPLKSVPGQPDTPVWDEGGDKLVWETHTVTLNKVPSLGFGIAVSGGRDNPHFANGDPSIAVSDVLKSGPAEGRLMINDRILSVNGIPLDNVDHATAISVLTDSGNSVTLVVRRKVILPPTDEFDVPYKVTLTKKNKKEDYGVVLGYRLFVKEVTANSLAAQEGDLKEGDTILKINNQPIESLSLYEAKKQIEKSKDKLQLVIKSGRRPKSHSANQRAAEQDPSKSSPLPGDYASKQDNIYGSADRQNLRPISFAQLDRPASPLLGRDGQKVGKSDDVPPRPPLPNHLAQEDGPARPPSPSQDYLKKQPDYSTYGDMFYNDGGTGVKRRPREPGSEPRFISFKKDGHGSVGICISGGNRSGIFVHKVAKNTPAEQQGLHEGDVILKVKDVDLRGKTREEALLLLTGLREQVNLLVVYRREEYDALMSSGGSGDFFHIRTHFNYVDTEHGEMSFRHYDVFRVTNTLHNGIIGSWEVVKVSAHNNKESKKGIIPNKNRAEQMCLANNPDKENIPTNQSSRNAGKGGSFFKKKTARRAKSLGRDHWDDIIFAGVGGTQRRTANPNSKFAVYERVVLRDCGFVRPVVILGPLADVAIDKLIREKPERYMSPQTDMRDDETKGRSTIIRFGAIRDIRDRAKHSVLDITPSAIDRLNYNQFMPIVLFLRPESKQAVKELRQKWAKSSKKSYRKLYEHAVKLEKSFSYLFSHTIALTNGMAWYRKLQEAIEEYQRSSIWMSEIMPPEENPKDDYLFPMGHRLSYASSPESDLDLRSHGMYEEDESVSPRHQRLVRSSSDPSINTAENIPGIPPYPVPPSYRDPKYDAVQPYDRPPHHSHYDRHPSHRRGPHESDRGPHRDDRHYPYYHPDNAPRNKYPHNRANIDPYATLTPSERLRGQQLESGYRSDTGRTHRRSPVDRDRRRSALDHLPRGGPYPHSLPDENIYAYGHQPSDYDKDPRQHSDVNGDYLKYTTHPANRHDDSKLQEKFGPHNVRSTPEKNASRNDPYRYTRSTINPYQARMATIDKSKLSDLSGKYPNEDPYMANMTRGPPNMSNGGAPHNSPSHRSPQDREPLRAKSETNVYQESRDGTRRTPQGSTASPYFKSQPNLDRLPTEGDKPRENVYEPVTRHEPVNRQRLQNAPHQTITMETGSPSHGSHSNDSDADKGYESRPESTYERPNHYRAQSSNSGRPGPAVIPKTYKPTESHSSANGVDTVPSVHPKHPPQRSYSNQLYMDPAELQSAQNTSKDTYSSRDSGLPSSLDRQRNQSLPESKQYNSAFESYRKPSPNSTTTSSQPPNKAIPTDEDTREGSLVPEDTHTVVATARGVFDSNGGVLESKETGVSIIIPKGALTEGIQQEIYFKVCQDNSILPPLDKDKGETLLSPLVMCGPHGLKFLQPVELRLPHCASVNPDSWSFALKSSGSPQGKQTNNPTQWQNMTLAGIDGISQGKVGKSSVSVLVDHF